MSYRTLIYGVVLGGFPLVTTAQSPTRAAGDESSADAGAQAVEEIIVTAQRRAERLVDVPISVNSISQADLETKRIDSLLDLTKAVTSLRFENTQPSFQPTLRGIGTQVQGGGVDTSVAVYMDDVFMPNMSGMSFDLPNVQNVQVLKGPQGTLFGRNATGGAILITTAEPSSEPTGRVKLTYADYEDVRAQGYLSGPFSENVSGGLSVYYRDSNGFFDNIHTGADDDARVEMLNVRPDILITNNDNLRLRLIYEHLYAWDATSAATTNPDGYAVGRFIPGTAVGTGLGETAEDKRPKNLNKSDAVTAILNWTIAGSMNFKSVTSYREDSNEFEADGDASSLPMFSVATATDYETMSQEFTLAHKSGALDWLAGVYYWNQDVEEPSVQVIYGPPFTPVIVTQKVKSARVETQAIAGFLDATYQVTEGLFLTAGARYSTERKELSPMESGVVLPTIPDDHRWNAFTPRAVLRYQLNSDSNVYASYSEGFKSGAYTGYPPNRVDPEKIDAFEVGFKHSSGEFDLNASAFYYDYTDAQVSIFNFQTGLGETINAEKQENYGVELETAFRPMPNWRISLSAAYLHAEFDTFSRANTYVQVGGGVWAPVPQPADGTVVPRSPEWSGNLATSYDIDVGVGTIQLAANVAASSKFIYYVNDPFHEPDYAQVDLNVSFTSRDTHWRGEVFVTNLTDHHRRVQMATGPTGTVGLWAAPRVIGGAVTYSF